MEENNKFKSETINLTIPVKLIITDNIDKEGNKEYFISTTDETNKLFDQWYYGTGKSLEEATKQFWISYKVIHEYYKERSNELDKWKPFQKGPWGKTGGNWFTIFGFHFYFRYGKGMQGGGRYVPFTKLNVMINSSWRKPKTNKK